ncbi:MAG: hypothetical protein ABSG62_21700 [Terracidiphilus sp.]|jgi:hypothetical protein
MTKPRLTKKVLDGLKTLAIHAQTGTEEDIMDNFYDVLSPE